MQQSKRVTVKTNRRLLWTSRNFQQSNESQPVTVKTSRRLLQMSRNMQQSQQVTACNSQNKAQTAINELQHATVKMSHSL